MRVGIIGGGTIARLVLEHVRAGDLGGARVVAILTRSASTRGLRLVQEFGVPLVTGLDALVEQPPALLVQTPSH